MSTFGNNNIQQLLVGSTAAKTATGNVSSANTGEIVVIDAYGGAILTEATALNTSKFKIGVNTSAGVHVISDVIERSKVNFHGVKEFAAATEQISYIGYNGTSGAIALNDNELYYARLYMEDLFNRASSDGRRVKHGVYRSGSSTTQELIATNVVQSLILNFLREAEKQILFEAICNDAGAALTGTATAFTVSEDNKSVAIDGTLTNVAVGDYIRIGGTTTDVGVHRVTEYVASSHVKLASAYQGVDAVIGVGGVEVVTAANAATADWGIRMEGVPADFVVGKIKYKKVRFEAQVDTTEGFGEQVSTPITLAQAASNGTGTIETIAELEWFTVGNEGEFFRMGEPLIFDSRNLADNGVAGGGYAMISLGFVDDSVVGFQPNVSPKVVTLAIPATTPDYALTATADDITDVLEVLVLGATDGSLDLG